MSRLAALLVALTKDWLRSREAVFFALLFPVLLLVIFSTVFAGGAAEFTLYVQNQDVVDGQPTDRSEQFVAALEGVDALDVQRLSPETDLDEWATAGESTGSKRALRIREGFADRMRSGAIQARVAVVGDTVAMAGGTLNDSDRAAIERGMTGLRAAANASGAAGLASVELLTTADDQTAPAVRGVVRSVVARFNDEAVGVEQPPVTVATDDLAGENLDAVDYYLPAIVAAVVMINGLITVTAVVAGFNSDGTYKRLVATPLRRREWILATVLQQAVLAVILTGVLVAVAHLLFGVTAVPGPLSLVLIVLGSVAFTGAGMALGTFVADPDAAVSLGNAVAFPMMFLGGVFWEIELMPSVLQTVAQLLPLYHFHRGLRQLLILETTEGTLVPFAVMGVGAVAAVALAVSLTDWRDLDG